jgi:ElaB/YqjD/DUF883 family membrane-anchored ribosome-binding protein
MRLTIDTKQIKKDAIRKAKEMKKATVFCTKKHPKSALVVAAGAGALLAGLLQ